MADRIVDRAVIFLALLLVLTLTACGRDESAAEASMSEGTVVPVAVGKARTREVVDELFSVGRLISRNTPSLAAEIEARVVEVLADEGEPVEAGQLLVRLDTTAVELQRREAQAEIQRLKASIENEKRRVDRYRDLKTKNVMSQEGSMMRKPSLRSIRRHFRLPRCVWRLPKTA